jgi:anti-sigma factor RsiW
VSAPDHSVAQALAYVDDCLDAHERGAFEERLFKDQALAARVEQWRRQNEAIRLAFNGALGSRESQNEVQDPLQRFSAAKIAPVARLPVEGRATRDLTSARSRQALTSKPAEGWKRSPARRRFGRVFAWLAVGFMAWTLSVAPAPVDRETLLAKSAFSTYRTFATGRPVEFPATEPAALERWFQTQLGAFVAIPNLNPAGFALLGGRVVAGAQGPAALALYRDAAGRRVSFISERGDSARVSQSSIQTSGNLSALTFAASGAADETIVSDLDEDTLLSLQNLIIGSPKGQ